MKVSYLTASPLSILSRSVDTLYQVSPAYVLTSASQLSLLQGVLTTEFVASQTFGPLVI